MPRHGRKVNTRLLAALGSAELGTWEEPWFSFNFYMWGLSKESLLGLLSKTIFFEAGSAGLYTVCSPHPAHSADIDTLWAHPLTPCSGQGPGHHTDAVNRCPEVLPLL